MIDKRFVVENYSVRDMSIDEKYVNSSYHIGDKGIAQSLCDLLNELYEENKKLLRRNGAMEEEIERARKMHCCLSIETQGFPRLFKGTLDLIRGIEKVWF